MFLQQYIPVTVKLQVARHLPVWHSVGRLLQAQSLEVHADAAVRDDEVRVHGTFDAGGTVARGKMPTGNSTFYHNFVHYSRPVGHGQMCNIWRNTRVA